jgi:hypothetical protein
VLVGLGGASSCLYQAGERCDPGQTYDADAGLCVCAGNTVAAEHGCIACAEHELALNGVCGCAKGYVRPTPDAACAIVPDALGATCQVDQDCADSTFNTCQLAGDGGGYCTSVGCAANSDCTAGYGCNLAATPSYCQRPPDGAGKSCASDADCAGTAATFCETFNSHICYVEGCSLTSNDCFPGEECCDLTGPSFGVFKKQICVDAGSCPM